MCDIIQYMKKYTLFLVVFILLFSFGIFNLKTELARASNLAQDAYTITGPSTATVGSIIKFTAVFNGSTLGNCQTNPIQYKPHGEICYMGNFLADPFYLQPTGNFGEYKVINPGSTKVYISSPSGRASATISLTGSGASGSGSVKISESKDLTDLLYPEPGNCQSGGVNCAGPSADFQTSVIRGFADGGKRLFDSMRIYLGQMDPSNPSRPFFYESGPMIYDLSSPMTPSLMSDVSFPNRMMTVNDRSGDLGGGPYLTSEQATEDGSFVAASGANDKQIIWAGDTKYIDTVPDSADGFSLLSLGNKTIMVMDNYPPKDESYFMDAPCFGSSDGQGMDSACGVSVKNSKQQMPTNFPKMRIGEKVILGSEKYIASLEVASNKSSSMPGDGSTDSRLAIYSVTASNPVAKISLSSKSVMGGRFVYQAGADGDYFFYIQNVSANGANSNMQWKLFAYKFDSTSKKLTKLVDGANLLSGFMTAAVGVRLGSSVGVAVESYAPVTGSDSSGGSPTEARLSVYMLADLISGNIQNALTNMPYYTRPYDRAVDPGTGTIGGNGGTKMDSTFDDTSAYIYLLGIPSYVLKLDSTSGGSASGIKNDGNTNPVSSGCSSSGPYNVLTGALCPTDLGCTSAGPYSSTTGKLCSTHASPQPSSTPSTPSTSLPNGCAVGDIISTLTGKVCSLN